MNIIITGNDAPAYLNQTGKVRWMYSSRKEYLAALLFFLFGAIILIIGLNSGYTMTTTSFKKINNFTTQYTNLYNYHISLGLGIGFILIALYFVNIINVQKRKFFTILANIGYRQRKFSEDFSITINNDGIRYRDFETFYESKWGAFRHYKLYKDTILLFQEQTYPSTVVIQKSRLSEKDYADLLNFIKTKLSQK